MDAICHTKVRFFVKNIFSLFIMSFINLSRVHSHVFYWADASCPSFVGGLPDTMQSAVRMIKVISAVALGLGVVNAALASLLTAGLPSLFTPDPAVWAAMREVSPLCGLSLGLHGVTMAFQVRGFSSLVLCFLRSWGAIQI